MSLFALFKSDQKPAPKDIENALSGNLCRCTGYAPIIDAAEKEADIIIWDGGNNDFPFYKPSKHIVIVDPHRVGHELYYYPGETNVRMADIVVVSKVNTAKSEDIKKIKENVKSINPSAVIIDARIIISAEEEEKLSGKKVLVIEDGPTLTHGEMKFGAATIKAKEMGAEIIDPRPYAKGTIKEVYDLWPHLGKILPAVGYSEHQMKELEDSINAVQCDIVLMGTPTDLRRYLDVNKPVLRVNYEYNEVEQGSLIAELEKVLP